ncbi:redoxin domain-containing protein [Candidatus Roizmanbacteria bacterium]|nr:redoxin domain-containing protein [Candidatus Roizmanbacteria bacterium]
MDCCKNGENHNKQEADTAKKQPGQYIFTFSIDKFLTYILATLVIGTIVVGYSLVSNKNKENANVQRISAQNNPAANQADDMASHHGGGTGPAKKFEPLAKGTDAPNFSLPTTTGSTISLADYKGKDVLLFFNEGVMCSPCWQEVSRLERYRADFDNLNAVIIPISVDDQQTWDPILKEEKIVTPILIDAERKVATAYKVLGTPSSMHDDRPGHTYVHITPEGKIHASVDFPDMNSPTSGLIEHIKQSQS